MTQQAHQELRQCRACLVVKSHSEYYLNGRYGLKLECKQCYCKLNNAKSASSKRAWQKTARGQAAQARWRRTERCRQLEAQRRKTDTYAESHKLAVRKERVRHPDKCRARSAVSHAVASGKIVRPQQCSCGRSPVQAHHHNGYAPDHHLDIIWLCSSCHGAQHRKDNL